VRFSTRGFFLSDRSLYVQHDALTNSILTKFRSGAFLLRGDEVTVSVWARVAYPGKIHYVDCCITKYLFYVICVLSQQYDAGCWSITLYCDVDQDNIYYFIMELFEYRHWRICLSEILQLYECSSEAPKFYV